jgi:hypothetical protein
MDMIETYREKAKVAYDKFHDGVYRPFAKSSDDESHIIHIAASIMMTRDNVLRGGSFVCAVIDNDLDSAISRADSTCLKHMGFFVHCKNFVHIN